jgi:hypothetical protein
MPLKSRGSVNDRLTVWFSATRRAANASRVAAMTSMPPASSAASPARPATTWSDARRCLPASVSASVPVAKAKNASAFGAVVLPRSSQRSRPAIMRWTTTKRSPSNARTMRLPSRSTPTTVRPSTAEIGGVTERSRNGWRIEMRSRRWPTVLAASRST